MADGGEQKVPWYAVKDVPIFFFRVNRRPGQPSLFSQQDMPDFMDHVTEVLLFGPVIVTGRRFQREWRLGNRLIDASASYLSGWVGYDAVGEAERDRYDEATNSWGTETVEEEQTARAPFAIAGQTRILAIVKHPKFNPGGLAIVFQNLLNMGEDDRQRADPTVMPVEWAVEPLLDESDFDGWLNNTPVLDYISFSVKLPNPDADEAFREVAEHLRHEDADLTHILRPRDKERGLNRDLRGDKIASGLLEMANRSFAIIRAKGRSALNRSRTYDQTSRVRKGQTRLPPGDRAAQQALGEYIIRQDAPGADNA